MAITHDHKSRLAFLECTLGAAQYVGALKTYFSEMLAAIMTRTPSSTCLALGDEPLLQRLGSEAWGRTREYAAEDALSLIFLPPPSDHVVVRT
jgi:hypothetical protein